MLWMQRQERIPIMPFHGPELIIVVVIALLIFGPKKLPEMGSSIGKGIREFKKGMNDLTNPKDEPEEIKDDPSKSAAAARLELESIEREIANKKAALAAQERAQAEVNATETQAEMSTAHTHVD
jgi:sec-independent protein translocase protein TatA